MTSSDWKLILEASRRLAAPSLQEELQDSSAQLDAATSESSSYKSSSTRTITSIVGGVTSKVTSWAQSFLSYYDLVDTIPQTSLLVTDSLQDDYQQNLNYEDTDEADLDDAQIQRRPPTQSTRLEDVHHESTKQMIEDQVMTFVDTCRIILNHASDIIRQNQDSSTASIVLCSAMLSNQDSGQVLLQGIPLNIHGFDTSYSFHSFCQRAILAHADVQTNHMQSVVSSSLDIIMKILISSGLASLSADTNILVLFPLCPRNAQAVLRKTFLDTMNPNIIFNEIDMAIFKLTYATWTLEQRMTHLSASADTLQRQALMAKQQSNTNLALVHMRRRKMILDESDRLQATLLNIESGLQTLHRTKNDVQIVQSFELLHSTLKYVQSDEAGLGINRERIIDLMESIREGRQELDMIHEELAWTSDGTEELEAELQALQIECSKEEKTIVPDNIPETTKCETLENVADDTGVYKTNPKRQLIAS